MRKRIFLFFILLLIVMTAFYPEYRQTSKIQEGAQAEENLLKSLHAQYAALVDGDTGEMLLGKNAQDGAAMASTTKIMTCITALESVKQPETCVMSSYAASQPKVHLGVSVGEEFDINDLLYSMMLESHNDSAAAVAENIGAALCKETVRSDTDNETSKRYLQAFLNRMNEKAEKIGCQDTYFMTPNGLDKEEGGTCHHSTAEDMAKILRYCIYLSPEREAFLAITQTQDYQFSNKEGNRSFGCRNHNQLFQLFDHAVSGKTGFTNKAGYCYVGAVESDGRRFIVALLACGWPNNRGYKWEDVKKLIDYGEENFERANLSDEDPVCGKVIVENAKKDLNDEKMSVSVKSEEKSYFFLKKRGEKLRTEISIPKKIEAPVEKGETVGEVAYYSGDKRIASVKMTAQKGAEKVDFPWCICQIAQNFMI